MTGLDVEAVLRDHWPDPVFGCECTPVDDESGQKAFLETSWEAHVAAVLRVEIESALGDAWDAGLDAGLREPNPSESLELPPNPYHPTLAATEGDRQ